MRALLIAAVLAAGSLSACSADELAGGDCIILTNGGNKLCGEDAKVWCDSSDNLRDTTGMEDYLSFSDKQTIAESQAACDEIRGR